MLKDSRSYEVQIIDAVRSVNKALGGTYGTSSAIYKSEFNQYEVQLIDAIKGIGRTLSSKGLSLVGGGVGEVTAEQFQALSQRVTKLEQESFFRLVDGNVTLKPEYQNLWVPGWLAAGGIGNGSGGGGGVTHLYELEDVYHGTATVLRADGTDALPGDTLVLHSTLGWVAAPVGSGTGTVTGVKMNGSTLSPSPTGIVDLGTVITSLSGYATESDMKAWVQQQGYLTSFTETDPTVPAWAKASQPALYIGTTRVQTTETPQHMTGILSVQASSDLLSKFVWDDDHDAWRFLGNLYADGWVASGGIGSGSGGGGTDLATVWASLTNSAVDPYANTKINIAHIPTLTTSNITDLETWIAGKGYITTESDPTVPAWAKNPTPQFYIGTTQVQTTQTPQDLTGIISINATSDANSASRIVWEPNAGGTGIGAWHFLGNLYADGWVAAGGIGSVGGGGGVSYLRELSDVYHDSNGVLRANGNSVEAGDALVYDSTHGWLAAPISVTGVVKKIACGGYNNLTPDANGLVSITQPVVDQIRWYVNENIIITRNLTSGTPIASIQLGGYNSQAVQLYAPSGGGGGGGSTVSVSPRLYSGVAIADITVDSSTVTLYAPAGGGGVSVLDDLDDVSLSNETNGQALIYRNGSWVNETIQGGGSTVSVNQILTTGTAIADIVVNGVTTTVYAPAGGGGGGGGTVTSVAMTVPNGFSVTGSPITGSGTLAVSLESQTKNKFLASPASSSGTPSFRTIVASDLPDLSDKYVTLDTTQNNISGEKTFTSKPLNIAGSSGIKVASQSYIDLGPVRIKFDNNAIHITKADPNDQNEYGIYADGFVAAGGIQ